MHAAVNKNGNTNIRPFYEHDLPSLLFAKIGSEELLLDLKNRENFNGSSADVRKAIDLMFEAHLYQKRPDGSAHINHSLLVAKILVKKFDIIQPEAVIASLLHDGPEDQAGRILQLMGKEPVDDPQECIHIIANAFSADSNIIQKHLSALTNPNYEILTKILKGKAIDPALQEQAENLMHLYRAVTYDQKKVSNFNTAALKNALYLGHIVKISLGNRITFAIKLADIYCNAMHHHLLCEKVSSMAQGRAQDVLRNKEQKLSQKYKPVIRYLDDFFFNAEEEGKVIISDKADKMLRNKLFLSLMHFNTR